MCLLLLAVGVAPRYPLVVAANRDELYARPAEPLHWWPGGGVLAGRDVSAGGSWLGVSRTGRFAAITNVAGELTAVPGRRSRGELVAQFLETEQGPEQFLSAVARRAGDYAGFNLVVGAPGRLYHLSNRADSLRPTLLTPGFHAVSNALLDTPWPKARRGLAALEAVIAPPADGAAEAPERVDALLDLLGDRSAVGEAELVDVLPRWPRPRVQATASIFVRAGEYGTRCSTVLLFGADGEVRVVERSYDAAGEATGEVAERFAVR